jgi:hypothetical protein
MAALPPSFDPGDEPDPREAGFREQAPQPAGQQPGRRRAGYAVIAILLLTLLAVAVLVLVL